MSYWHNGKKDFTKQPYYVDSHRLNQNKDTIYVNQFGYEVMTYRCIVECDQGTLTSNELSFWTGRKKISGGYFWCSETDRQLLHAEKRLNSSKTYDQKYKRYYYNRYIHQFIDFYVDYSTGDYVDVPEARTLNYEHRLQEGSDEELRYFYRTGKLKVQWYYYSKAEKVWKKSNAVNNHRFDLKLKFDKKTCPYKSITYAMKLTGPEDEHVKIDYCDKIGMLSKYVFHVEDSPETYIKIFRS